MSHIFLSYAREDILAVHEIYRKMKAAGLDPWMDKPPAPYALDGIKPGQEWEALLREKLRSASLVMLFLSRASVAKQGFVQREYRLALSYAMEKPQDSVYMIPVLLEECDPPDYRVDSMNLQQFQWYPLYEYGDEPLIEYLRDLAGLPRIPGEPEKEDVEPMDPKQENIDSSNLRRLENDRSLIPLVITLQNRIHVLQNALIAKDSSKSEADFLRQRLLECTMRVEELEADRVAARKG